MIYIIRVDDSCHHSKMLAMNEEEDIQLLNAVVDGMIDGLVIIDTKGTIVKVNPATAKLFGYHADEILGGNVKMLMPSPHTEQHDQYLINYMRSGIGKIIGKGRDVIGLKKNGATFPFRLSITEVRVKDECVFAGIIHDISFRKLAEETQIALEKEKELNEMKTRFVSMASHEFRTPLSTILTSTTLIDRYKEEAFLDKREKHIKRIKSAVHNMKAILNDFLSISKLEEGKVENSPLYFDLFDFCLEEAEEMQAITKRDQIIVYEHLGGDKQVFLDKKLLTNILHNLLSNAIKYSSEESRIYLSTFCDETLVRLIVKDEGIGIPKEEQGQLFTRFFRANNVSNIQGTGLGLNIVQRYVSLMKGEITFDSNKSGTEFTLIFKK